MAPVLPEIERRSVALDQANLEETDSGFRFTGHAAVFDEWSEDLGGFRERIQRGAFRKTLRSQPDVRLLFNHDPNLVLARSTVTEGPGSLRLEEDNRGLHVSADLVETSAARDLRELMRAGVVSQMSFGFSMKGGEDEWRDTDDGIERTITEFGGLYDVSPVTFPAYPQTDGAMRSLVCGYQIYEDGQPREDLLRAVSDRIQRGTIHATLEERARLDAAFAELNQLSPWTRELAVRALGIEPDATAPTDAKDGVDGAVDVGRWRLAARKRLLELSL